MTLPAWLHIQTFYNSLSITNRSMIDAAAERALMYKTHEEQPHMNFGGIGLQQSSMAFKESIPRKGGWSS